MNKTFEKYFNPYRNAKTIQWALDNLDGFAETITDQQEYNEKEAFSYDIHAAILNGIGCHDERDKAARWAYRNYEDLEFSFETSYGYGDVKTGQWRQADDEESRAGGIYVASIPLSEEIELQAESGDWTYYYTGPRFIRILAAIA